jgi:hypothetical protein
METEVLVFAITATAIWLWHATYTNPTRFP